MAEYRLYIFDSRNHRLDRFETFEARDDDEALALIEPRIGDHPLELWTGGRKIGQFESALALSGIASASMWMPREAPDHMPQRRMFSSWS
jgi:hypothetical protein